MPKCAFLCTLLKKTKTLQIFDLQRFVFFSKIISGETGIRTLGTLASTMVFETTPIDHSGISPRGSTPRPSRPQNGGGKTENERVEK